MVSWLVLRFSLCPGSHFSIPFFPWLEATQERRGSRVKGAAFFAAFIEAQRRPLTWLPRSVHSPWKKWDYRLLCRVLLALLHR
jgi:hypothetical protein